MMIVHTHVRWPFTFFMPWNFIEIAENVSDRIERIAGQYDRARARIHTSAFLNGWPSTVDGYQLFCAIFYEQSWFKLHVYWFWVAYFDAFSWAHTCNYASFILTENFFNVTLFFSSVHYRRFGVMRRHARLIMYTWDNRLLLFLFRDDVVRSRRLICWAQKMELKQT